MDRVQCGSRDAPNKTARKGATTRRGASRRASAGPTGGVAGKIEPEAMFEFMAMALDQRDARNGRENKIFEVSVHGEEQNRDTIELEARRRG